MKLLLILLILSVPTFLKATPSEGSINFGLLVMFGARHDNVRMCVASPAGKKTGPVGDIMLTIRYGLSDRAAIGADIPVMRPVLFGSAFNMLQFEPQLVFDLTIPSDNVVFITSLTIGPSFHYGPDYKSDNQNRSPSFFARGPNIGLRLGMGFGSDDLKNIIAIRPFYTVLFSSDYDNGSVIGGALEYIRSF